MEGVFYQCGDTIRITGATGGHSKGEIVVVRSGTSGFCAVCLEDIAAGAVGEARVTCVHKVTKDAGTGKTWTIGAKIYWNATDNEATTTATGNTLLGTAWAAAGATDTTGYVKLQGL